MNKPLQFIVLIILSLGWNFYSNAQITLTNNIGTTPIETNMFSCEEDEGWSRVFKLSDFGISGNEQFIINSGQIALSKSYEGANLQFSIYSIDANFPVFFYSLYPRTLLGTRGIGQTPIINGAPEIIQVDFEEPIIVPAGIDRILVTVHKNEDFYNPASAQVFIAGTEEDTGVSWYEGCEENYSLTPTTDLTIPVPNANFYINVTGNKFSTSNFGTNTTLTHNACNDIIETNIHSCTSSYIYWARAFTLEEFGISVNEEFVINSGQVGINKTGWLPEISFNIYKIDNNFPASFSETDLIGSSQYQQLSPNIGTSSQIIEVDFDTPIVIPRDVERILVEVHKGIVYGDGVAFIAGSIQDNDVSWQRGCTNVAGGPTFDNNEYVTTADFGRPDANFYINVTGNVNHVTNNFEMNISNICSEFLKEFNVEDASNVASIVWNFGDPASGVDNTSMDLSPYHDFSADGIYTITATVTANNGSVEVLTETIDVKEPPNAYGISNIEACEIVYGTGISSSFDTSNVLSQVLGCQTDKVVTFIDGSGNTYNVLPNPFTNTISDRETITVRVSRSDEPCCYSEITFDLFVHPLPNVSNVEDVFACEDDTNGFARFNLSQIQSDLTANNTNVDFYFQDGQQIVNAQLNEVINRVQNHETITVKLTNTLTNCYNETTFNLIVNSNPEAFALENIIGCDTDNDGISEYFDTSNIETTVIGNQSGIEVTYYDSNGNELPNPLPNPFTNSTPFNENITVRVTDLATTCYAETLLILETSSKPSINQPQDIFACDEGSGYASFDTSAIETELIGNQTGLQIFYFDLNGNELASPLPNPYTNTTTNAQTINIRVENSENPLCYSETTVDLIVNELPQINLENEYLLCDLEPFLYISTTEIYNSWEWKYQDGTTISTTFEANLVKAGTYTLTVSEIRNNITCDTSFSFDLIRSVLPVIEEVRFKDLSDVNYIEIIAVMNGNFEYSIDGFNYQDSNLFESIPGGVYTAFMRDKDGCGQDTKEVILIDYPNFFTPNNDNTNDYWQIYGVEEYPNARINIFDRFGKLLKQIAPNDEGWNGIYNGELMPASDYWFIVDLNNGRSFKGHFSLKR